MYMMASSFLVGSLKLVGNYYRRKILNLIAGQIGLFASELLAFV